MKIYVHKFRRAFNITLEELEEISGVSKSQIQRIEGGESIPTILTLCHLATAMHIDITDLFECD